MRAITAALAAGLLIPGLAACGGGGYGSAEELKDAVVEEAGLDCPEFTQVDPSGYSAGHGSCADSSFPDYGFGLDVFESNEDRDKEIAAFNDLPIPWCIAYGEGWAVTFSGDADEPNCQIVADRMDGEVKSGEAA